MSIRAKLITASRDELNKEIAERKKKEEELQKLNRTLRAISNSSQTMMLAKDESQYLREVCNIIIKDCGHAMVWIGFAENDAAKSVRPVAYSGFENGYLETLKITWADTERGRGPTGTAIRTGKTRFCRNMLTDPAFEPWRQEALERGYASSVVLPLLDGDKAFGAVTIYSKKPDQFSEDEVTLLAELAGDLSYGIRAIRLRIAHNKAEKEIRRSVQRFALLSETAGRLLKSKNPQQIIESLCRRVIEHLDCQVFFNFLVDEKTGRLHLNAFAGIPANDAGRIEWLDFGVAVCGCVARDAIRIVAEHIPTTPDERTELIRSYGIKAYACYPLLGPENKVIGTLSFGARNKETFSDEDLALMKAVSDQVATAMMRRQSEEALRRTSNYLENIFNYANAPIICWNPNFEITRFNHAFERLTSYTQDEVIGKNLNLLFSDDSREESLNKIQRTLTGEHWEVVEIPIRRKDGEIKIALWNSANVYADDGKTLLATIAQGQDITKRKQAEDKLRESEERFRVIASNTPDHIIIQDRDLRYSFVVNPQMGLTKQDMIGKTDYDILTKENADKLTAIKRQIVDAGVPSGQLELPMADTGGGFQYFEGSFVPTFDAKEQVIGIIGYFKNITDRKRTEEALKAAHDTLETQVKERTQELKNSNTILALEIEERKQVEKLLTESEQELRILSSQLITAQEDERKRVAMELHDDISSKLAAIKFGLERNLMHPPEDKDQKDALSQNVIATVKEAMISIRRIMVNLRPSMIDHLGLLPTITWHSREFQKVYDTITIASEIDIEEIDIPEELKITIFRVIQEAMNNIGKYSEASRVRVCLKVINETIKLLIEDNGRGFEVKKGNTDIDTEIQQGFGIISMKERIRQSGGTFSIESGNLKGTIIRATWPKNF